MINKVPSPSIYFGLSKRKIKDIKKAGGLEKYEILQRDKQTKRKNNVEETQASKKIRIDNNLIDISLNQRLENAKSKNQIKKKPKKQLTFYDYIKSMLIFYSKILSFANINFFYLNRI